MGTQRIKSAHVPEPAGEAYSQCLVVDGQVYLSGMIAMGPDGQPVGGADVYLQAKECIDKCRLMLEAAGASLADVVKMTVYLTDMSKREGWNRVRAESFAIPRPCSTLIEVKGLARPGMLIELDVTAVRGANRSAAT